MLLPSKTLFLFVLLSAACTLLLAGIHFWPGNNSMLNLNAWPHLNEEKTLNEEYLAEAIAYHQTEPSFKRRVLTTKPVLFLAEKTALSLGQSFVVFNFFMLFLAGILVSILAFSVAKSRLGALLSTLLFFLSFPILFAFFATIYSYDDPLQYVFLLLTLLYVIKEKYWTSALFFAFSLFTRESSIIVLPGILFLAARKYPLANTQTFFKKTAPFLLVSVLFFTQLLLLKYATAPAALSSDISERFFGLNHNFGQKQFAIESVFSFLLVCLLAIISWSKTESGSVYKKAFWITLILNTIVVLLFTKARESRLFFLPLLFWLPLAGELIWNKCAHIIHLMKERKWLFIFLIPFFALLSYTLAFQVYIPTATRDFENWHNEYLFVLLTFALLLSLKLPSKKHSNG